MTYEIKLPLFEGPFDLLLFFIERDELDIHDIPIARITADFLDYLHTLEQVNLDLASDFIWVAGTLIRIKAKSLLPRPELNEQGEEIDPREELVRHLLEYRKFKAVSSLLAQLEEEQAARQPRGNVAAELAALAASQQQEELEPIHLFKLLQVFQRVLKRHALQQARPTHTITEYPFTIAGQRQAIASLLQVKGRISFVELIELTGSRIAAIFNFLAVLEMAQQQLLQLSLGQGYNNFWLEARPGVPVEALA